MNDRVREKDELFQNLEDESIWMRNLEAMLSLLDPGCQDHRIMLAEIHRYQGNFEQSRQLIRSIDSIDMAWLIEVFELQIGTKNSSVFVLP